MLRSILIGLDGSADSASAIRLGIEWARRDGAMLVGLAIIDEPTIAAEEPIFLGGVPHADPIFYRERMADARRSADQFLEQFALHCAEAGVACKVLEDVGLPADEIALEAQRYDVVMLGRKTRFHFEVSERHDDTLERVLKESPRPVVVVPEVGSDSGPIVVAYDGRPRALRVRGDGARSRQADPRRHRPARRAGGGAPGRACLRFPAVPWGHGGRTRGDDHARPGRGDPLPGPRPRGRPTRRRRARAVGLA